MAWDQDIYSYTRQMNRFRQIFVSSPALFTFGASILLTALALTNSTLNRDGMLYVEAAQAFSRAGLAAAAEVFSWPFLSVLMVVLSSVSGLDLETSGHLLNLLFMAGASALLVSMVERTSPGLGWYAALVVLAIPGLNDYRNELIREYGCWFFVMLSFWLAQRWVCSPRWILCLGIQAAVLVAALFRPEALIFYPCLLAWQFFEQPEGRWPRTLALGLLPLLMFTALVAAHFADLLPESSRLAVEVSRFDFYAGFDQTARNMSQAFNEYAREEAETAHIILFFGSLAIVPLKFLSKIGIFILPLAYGLRFKSGASRELRGWSLFVWAFAFHALVLAIFALQKQFVSGRYLGFLMFFSTPLVALGLARIAIDLPRLRTVLFAACVGLMLANVISLKPAKEQYVEAGRWVSENLRNDSGVFIESPRAAYYAGLGFKDYIPNQHRGRNWIREQIAHKKFHTLVLEVSRKDKDFTPWVAQLELRERKRFAHPNGDAIVVLEVDSH